jgi:DnaJ-class molecular chaperone
MSTKTNESTVKFDPYEILGVDADADKKTIEKKFKKLAVTLHPDKNKDDPNANEKFQKLSKAKDILINDESREKYDRFGITDEQDEIKVNNEMMQEMMMKQRLRDVIQMSISLSEALTGFKKKLNLQREVINSIQRKQQTENFEITLEFNSDKPINKPIVFEGKGKKYDDLTGDLIIMLNIKPDRTYKINKSNFNLVTTQKISIAQSLCGFEMILPYSGKSITIQYDKLINPNNAYIVKDMGLNIVDESNNPTKSDIEIHFDVQYQDQLTTEQIDKLKEVFGYNYVKSIPTNDNKIQTITEHASISEGSENDEHIEMFEQMFGGGGRGGGGFPFSQMGGMSGIPGMGGMGGMGGMPGMPGMGGMGGMGGSSRVFSSGGQGIPGMGGNSQECKVQ